MAFVNLFVDVLVILMSHQMNLGFSKDMQA